MKKFLCYSICLYVFALLTGLYAHAQPGTSVDITKPEKYEKRKLGAERTGDKKFNFSRRLYNNTVSHYNYYFNGNQKLNEIIDQSKETFRDDFTKLIPFYNYSLDVTSGNDELDSIIYKCNAGILLHDLRSDWVDNLYLLLGKTYFYRKNFDSADQVFRYINYAFAPKEDGGYDIPVGSNAGISGTTFSISTKENSNVLKKAVSTPPSRNDALLWEAKNFIERNKMGEAMGLLQILKSDPVFPSRLQDDLHETLAYWYYREHVYDSAAFHLSKSMNTVANKQEQARREYLTGQLYELADSSDKAVDYFSRSGNHTNDAILEVYANLSSIKAGKGDTASLIKEKLDNLLKMAKRDKYTSNRDIIYYAAAEVERQIKQDSAAENLLFKSIRFNDKQENPTQRSKSFLMLADIRYANADYTGAKNYYDSVETGFIIDEKDIALIEARKEGLAIIAENASNIHDEDSLQNLAEMPKEQRDDLVKKKVKELNKDKAKKDNANQEEFVNPAVDFSSSINNTRLDPGSLNRNPTGLPGQNTGTGDWYFNNLNLKGLGYNQFRQKWGNRQNVDNWRRKAAMAAASVTQNANDPNADEEDEEEDTTTTADNTTKEETEEDVLQKLRTSGAEGEATFEGLYKNIPLTDEQKKASDEKLAEGLFNIAQSLQNRLEEYPAAISNYESIIKNYPADKHVEEALYNLVYCYKKTGRNYSADSAANALAANFKDGAFAKKIKGQSKENKLSPEEVKATKKYEEIYNLFINGKFDEAKTSKADADSLYGNAYWTPQLLYIESIYYVSKRDDSVAIEKLTALANQFGNTPLAEKATTMIEVLGRRNEIETYLTNLEIKRIEDDPTKVVDLTSVSTTIQLPDTKNKDNVTKSVIPDANKNIVDTSAKAPVALKSFIFNPNEAQFAALLMNKVDQVYANEARNAFNKFNGSTFYNLKLTSSSVKVNDNYQVLIIGPFTDALAAIKYIDKIKPLTSTRIVPWLNVDKYKYSIISQSNLDLLKENKDMESYIQMLEKALPGKF